MPDIRIPVLRDFEKAIKIYYSLYELGTNDIRSLFGDSIGAERARRLKRHAKEYAKGKGVAEINVTTVDTATAFEAWGLDIKNIESRYQKLQKLGIG